MTSPATGPGRSGDDAVRLDDVVRLDLGGTDEPPALDDAAGPAVPRSAVVVLAVVLLALLAGVSQPRSRPEPADVRVELTGGALVAGSVDRVVVAAEFVSDAPFDVELDDLSAVGLGDDAMTSASVHVPAGGRVEVPLRIRPQCVLDDEPHLSAHATGPGGSRPVDLAVAPVQESFSSLCPPASTDPTVLVTGWDPSGSGVRLRLVNAGPVEAVVTPTPDGPVPSLVADACCGLTLAEYNGTTSVPAFLSASPAFPLLLEAGRAVVLDVRLGPDPCRLDATTLPLVFQTQTGRFAVSGQDDVVARLAEDAAETCASAGGVTS